MHDGLTVGAGRPEPPPAPRRPHHRILAIVFTLAIVAAAVLASVMVYSAVRGPAKPAAAPASRPASSLAARVDPGLVVPSVPPWSAVTGDDRAAPGMTRIFTAETR
jgi:hypothetical protein